MHQKVLEVISQKFATGKEQTLQDAWNAKTPQQISNRASLNTKCRPLTVGGETAWGYRSFTSGVAPEKRDPEIDMLNEAPGLKTANLSPTTEEICRMVYREFLTKFDLQGKWQVVIRAVDTDRIFIQSCPTGNQHDRHLEMLTLKSQLATDLRHLLHANYRRYREQLQGD
jgi:hypothetical protein